MECVTNVVVQREDIDELEHVNNKVYVHYFEKGRIDWYSKSGLTIDTMRKRQLGTAVVKLTITFLKEARLGESLRIKTSPVRLGNTSFDLKQEIFNAAGEKITEALVTSVMFDLEKRKSTRVAPEIACQFR